MNSDLTKHRKNITVLALLVAIVMVNLSGRFAYLMLFYSEHYSAMAEDLYQRERTTKAVRGRVIDANGVVVADNRTVCIISVICNQVTGREHVVQVLCNELGLNEELARKRVEKHSSREIIKTSVDKELEDKIRSYRLDGVKVDENYKRYYPYDSLASKVLGSTRDDSRGIVELEVKYEKYLKGMNGKILTMSDVEGVEIESATEDRIEPVPGNDLHISLDMNIQKYAEQLAYQALEKENAKKVSIIVMNPRNRELLAMVNVPESNLNDPLTLDQNPCSQSLQEIAAQDASLPASKKQGQLNQMWGNTRISGTCEPGSTFEVITVVAGLESGAMKLTNQLSCPGFRIMEDRRIHYRKMGGRGSETFLQDAMNSYDPVFIDMRQRLGVDGYYKYFTQFGLKGKTGVNLPGKAVTIMHKKENMGLVKLAIVSFGQSFQITPIQLIITAASIVNGGNRITPHFGVATVSTSQTSVRAFKYPSKGRILSEETSATIRYVLEQIVSEGSGKKAKLEGYKIGDKTTTSGKFPRGLKKYISSFIGFAPAGDPQAMTLITIDEPEGIYYGGTTAAPVAEDLLENILPYLRIQITEEEAVVHVSNPQLTIPGKRRMLITK